MMWKSIYSVWSTYEIKNKYMILKFYLYDLINFFVDNINLALIAITIIRIIRKLMNFNLSFILL